MGVVICVILNVVLPKSPLPNAALSPRHMAMAKLPYW